MQAHYLMDGSAHQKGAGEVRIDLNRLVQIGHRVRDIVVGEKGESPRGKRHHVLRKEADRGIQLGDGATVGPDGCVYSRAALKIVAVLGNLRGLVAIA
jgi:hypothetical protein